MEILASIMQSAYERKYKPKCADCIHRLKRGNFFLCDAGKKGYRHIGEEVKCDEYECATDEN